VGGYRGNFLEDHKQMEEVDISEHGLLKMKKMVLQSQYIWRVACNSLLVSKFSEVLELCSLFL
jgi:hypothetical protein